MKNSGRSVCLALCLIVLIHSQQGAATISCYVCTATTLNTGNPCLPPVDTSKTCSTSLNVSSLATCVAVVSDCDSCVTEKTTLDGTTSYVRTCALAGTSTLANKCVTTNSETTCYSSCSTNLCNTGSDAPALRFALFSVLATLCLSTAASALF